MSLIPMPNVFSLDQLEAGVFWCARGALGIPEDDVEAYRAGTLPDQRRREIDCRIQMALHALHDAEVPGAQFWMSRRRMVS